MAPWRPVAGITKLRNQVNKTFPKRDKRSDGIIGDAAHQARPSDHNPDSRGYVHALDIDENFGPGAKQGRTARRLADQLVAYARVGAKGSERLKYVVYENQIASGTYSKTFWEWRGSGYGHTQHIHVSFTKQGEKDDSPFRLPVLGYEPVWDGRTPNIANVWKANRMRWLPSIAAWRVAARLYDLGFWKGGKPIKYVQRYPAKAVLAYQDHNRLPTNGYNKATHERLFDL